MRGATPTMLALAALLAGVWPESVRACPVSPTCRGMLLPAAGGTVPANVPGFLWVPGIVDAAPRTRLYAPAEGFDATVPTSATPAQIGGIDAIVLQLDATLVSSRAFVLLEEGGCGGAEGAMTTFRTTPAAPLPAVLGRLLPSTMRVESRPVASVGTEECARTTEVAAIDVALSLDAQSVAWRDLLVYRTEVDGETWAPRSSLDASLPPGTSWAGRAHDSLFAHCATDDVSALDPGLSEGSHRVRMIAELPGSDVEIATESIEIVLRCDPATPPPPPPPTSSPDASIGSGRDGSVETPRRRKLTSCAAMPGDGAGSMAVVTLAIAWAIAMRLRARHV